MTEHLAVKRLSDSDLTFFHYHHQHADRGGNQKSINLNMDVFIGQFFPGLPVYAGGRGNRVRVAFHLFGPGAAPEMKMAKHIIKGTSYRNWRLNGATVSSPQNDPDRFTGLRAGDFVVFNFIGDVYPTELRACLISGDEVDEAVVHSRLQALFNPENPRQSMVELSRADFEAILDGDAVSEAHPLRDLSFPHDIPEVVIETAVRAGRRMTATQIESLRKRQAQLGAWGEELGNQHLRDLVVQGEILSYDWDSRRNAASPFDFSYSHRNGDRIILDVKSTSGQFERPFNISWAELEAAATSPHYHIWRFSGIDQSQGDLRVCKDIRALAERILGAFGGVLPGVSIPGVIIHPVDSGLNWDPPVRVRLPGPDEDPADDGVEDA